MPRRSPRSRAHARRGSSLLEHPVLHAALPAPVRPGNGANQSPFIPHRSLGKLREHWRWVHKARTAAQESHNAPLCPATPHRPVTLLWLFLRGLGFNFFEKLPSRDHAARAGFRGPVRVVPAHSASVTAPPPPPSVSLHVSRELGTYLGFGVHRTRDIWHARVTGGDGDTWGRRRQQG